MLFLESFPFILLFLNLFLLFKMGTLLQSKNPKKTILSTISHSLMAVEGKNSPILGIGSYFARRKDEMVWDWES